MDFELKNIPIVQKRNLVKSGASIVLTLPKKWLEENKLGAGDEIILVANGDIQVLKSTNENIERLNEKISNIRTEFNNHTSRSDDQQNGRVSSSPSKLEE